MLASAIDSLPLFDHHCHGIVQSEMDFEYFTSLLTEADKGIPGREFDSPLGNFVLNACSRILGLDPHATPNDYWDRRCEIGNLQVSQQLIGATGIDHFGLDTGYRGDELTTAAQLSALVGRPVDVISRLETMAEELILRCEPRNFPNEFRNLLDSVKNECIGFKSVMAYRYGLDFDPERPEDEQVVMAAQSWSTEVAETNASRVTNPTILRFLLWSAVDIGKPIQIHIGYGDTDINLHRCDPSQMTQFLRLTQSIGTPIVLLHCYPFVRQAAILCQVFPHVWMDTSLGVPHSGYSATNIVRESLEVVPFSRLLFASDAFGLAEIYYAGAFLWKRAMVQILTEWIDHDSMSYPKALDIAERIAMTNAVDLYGVGGVNNG